MPATEVGWGGVGWGRGVRGWFGRPTPTKALTMHHSTLHYAVQHPHTDPDALTELRVAKGRPVGREPPPFWYCGGTDSVSTTGALQRSPFTLRIAQATLAMTATDRRISDVEGVWARGIGRGVRSGGGGVPPTKKQGNTSEHESRIPGEEEEKQARARPRRVLLEETTCS